MGATNPALEAAIDERPDDDDAYYVLGDWLQTQGDPRGDLIALHAAMLRDPADKKLAQLADKCLKDHAEELAGSLLAKGLVWRLGFVRDARIDVKTGAVEAVRTLVTHPSARFLQSLVVDRATQADVDAIVELLLARRGPVTLADLRLGRDWDTERDGEVLRTVFPRLARSLSVEWRALAATIAQGRKLDIKYDAAALPALDVIRGVDKPGVDAGQLLLGLRLELDKKKAVGVIAAMQRTFTPESLDRFAVALGQQFSAVGYPAAMRWGFDAMGSLGGPLATSWIASRLATWSHQRAMQGVGLLAKIGTGHALFELYSMISDPRVNRPRREDAAARLDRIARERAYDLDVLLDRSVPPVVGDVGRVHEASIRRLRNAMIDGRRLRERDFVHYYVRHPLIAPLARRVVWAKYVGHELDGVFRVTEDGRAIDLDDEDVDLAGGVIGVLHPAELDERERKSAAKDWGEVFERAGIEPLFLQLERPVYELRDTEQGDTLARFKLRTVGFDQLRSVLEYERDWTPERVEYDAGTATEGYTRYWRRDGVTVSAPISDGAIGVVTAQRGGEPLKLASLHAVTASELLYDLESATGRAGSDAVSTIDKGTFVQVTRGVDRGRRGVVFWVGDGNKGRRIGLRDDAGESYWVDLANVVAAEPKPHEAESAKAAAPEPAPPAGLEKGARVWIKAGPGRLRKGVLFWLGDGKDGPRCGIRGTDGEALWVDLANVALDDSPDDTAEPAIVESELEPEPAPAPDPEPEPAKPLAFAKGTRVTWEKGRHTGAGTVFWVGKNKFGEGMRVGVTDDETGETVWTDADSCKPA